jgi:hypothetical protein
MQYKLKLLTFESMHNEVPISGLPEVFCGTQAECNVYAENNGHLWKENRKFIFGGYWFKPSYFHEEKLVESTCLLPDIAKCAITN